MLQHEENWIALAEILGPRSTLLKPLLETFHTPEGIFDAGEEVLRAALPDVGAGLIASLAGKRTAESARRIALWCHRSGVRILTYDGEEYPERLRALDEPPAVLYCKGSLQGLSDHAVVGIVGPRQLDAYGQQVTYKLSFELAAAGAVIVSGMAQGADGVATAAALAAGGRAIAVLGCGIDITYPRHHGKLMAECAECGAVLTEYPPGTPPNGYHFPMRNRLISGLSDALLVTEAGEGSGALITARYAVIQGRALYAVPGDLTSPRSVGSNRLLQAGAQAALCAEDILAPLFPRFHNTLSEDRFREAMQYSACDPRALAAYGVRAADVKEEKRGKAQEDKEEKRAKKRRKAEPEPEENGQGESATVDTSALTPRQRELYDMLPATAFTVDYLTERGVPVAEAVGTLTVLEIYGLLASRPGGLFQRK